MGAGPTSACCCKLHSTQLASSEGPQWDQLASGKYAHMRIIAVNDVYLLDNFPRLRSLIKEYSQGMKASNVVTTLAGDFLAPSLLSSLDFGFGMIQVLNQLPMDYLCFGNHDGNDIPYEKLVSRISEFNGTWLNSNMPDFDPELPAFAIREIEPEDFKEPTLQVGLLGLCIGGSKFPAMYRDEAFGGAHRTMQDVVIAAEEMATNCLLQHPDLGAIIPITHQDMPEDMELAGKGLFAVIVAGHDHDQMLEAHNATGCQVVKAGQDAIAAAIIDLVWTDRNSKPDVRVTFKPVADFEPDPALAKLVDQLNQPVRELEQAVLYELAPGEKLTSVGASFHDVSMATKLASAVRDCLMADAAVVNSGAVRGKRDYDETIAYGDLKKECPYPSSVVVAQIPFAVMRDAIQLSRQNWASSPPKEANSALQIDDRMEISASGIITKLRDEAVGDMEDGENTLFDMAVDTYFLKKNAVLKEYCAKHPERIPPADAGRPLLPILVEYFCKEMWRKLMENAGGNKIHRKSRFSMAVKDAFLSFDTGGTGKVGIDELKTAVRECLGEKLSSNIMVEQMLQQVDRTGKGEILETDLKDAMRKVFRAV